MARKIHNIKFYLPAPRAIHHMALHESKSKIAVARMDASIEIWNISKAPFVEKLIPHNVTNNSIEGIVWCKDRLFSVSLEGFLVEYDLFELKCKNKLSVTGQSAYCLDINKNCTQIAIGTEQGYINVFSVNEEVLFEKFLDKQEGRILCIKYHPNEEFLVSGSLDFIRIWDVRTGQAIHKMSTGRSSALKPTIIWCLAVTDDFTIISGDSRGKLTFWDGNVGSQIVNFQTHKADILTILLSDDQKELHCAGVDTNIVSYSKIYVKDETYKWVKNIQRRVQDHDVRALVKCGGILYSGGVDGYLVSITLAAKVHIKFPPIMQMSIANICRRTNLIMLKYPRHLEIWSLGDVYEKLDSGPKRLLVVSKNVKYDGKDAREGIICSAISDDGCWIAYSTDSKLSILKFSYDLSTSSANVIKIKNIPEECEPPVQMTFTPFTNQLIIAKRSGELAVLKYSEDEVELFQNLKDKSLKDTIKFLLVSPCAKYLIATDVQSNVVVWHCDIKWKAHCKLPKYEESITAIAVQPETSNLLVAYNDYNIVEYDLAEKTFTKFSRNMSGQRVKFEKECKMSIQNIVFDSHEPDKIILHVGSKIVVLDKTKANCNSKSNKMRKLNDTSTEDGTNIVKVKNNNKKNIIHKSISKYDILAYLGNLSLDEYVAVEVPHLKLMEQLPPCLNQYKFGTN